MFRIVTLLALAAMLIVGGAGGAVAQAPSDADRQEEGLGLPPVTYDEIVGKPQASAGYSITAIAAGAIAGVMATNMFLPILGYSAVPAALAGVPVTGATLEAALATSRLVAVAGAAAGGLIGQWLYAGSGR